MLSKLRVTYGEPLHTALTLAYARYFTKVVTLSFVYVYILIHCSIYYYLWYILLLSTSLTRVKLFMLINFTYLGLNGKDLQKYSFLFNWTIERHNTTTTKTIVFCHTHTTLHFWPKGDQNFFFLQRYIFQWHHHINIIAQKIHTPRFSISPMWPPP